MGERLVVRAYERKEPEWPSISFAVRRWSRHAIGIDQPPTCPLAVSDARRYWWVRWAGIKVGAWPLLALTITNQSDQVIHSFMLRFDANKSGPASGVGTQPEGGLPPGAAIAHTNHESDGCCLSACIDFIQFLNGETWYSRQPEALATEDGVNAGRRAAATHLHGVLDRSGVTAVMQLLPRIHGEVMEPSAMRFDGPLGFYCGVTNLAVQVQHALDREGHEGVEALLRSPHKGD